MRKVLIGTPVYDGKLTVYYVNSLVNTLRMVPQGMGVDFLFIAYDALVQRARNDIFASAVRSEVDDLVFVDADQAWEPAWFYALLQHQVDAVGMLYPKKGDVELYPINLGKNPPAVNEHGLMQVDGLGMGFFRLTRKAMLYAWEHSAPYRENGIDKRMIFNVGVENGELVSEDILLCRSLRELGVYLDPRFTLPHIGHKVYTGNFAIWLTHLLQFERGRQQQAEAAAPPSMVITPIQPGASGA
jgi:hypothetical protein